VWLSNMAGSGAGSRPDKAAKAENALKNEKVVPVGFTTHVAASLHQSINERVFRTSKRTNLAGLIAMRRSSALAHHGCPSQSLTTPSSLAS
jgi:hypothetical protein